MILTDIRSSLMAFCSAMKSHFTDCEVVLLDAHADESTLPDSDFISLSGLTVGIEGREVVVTALVGACTRDDTNLFRLNAMTATIFDALLPEKRIPLLDASSGIEKSWMVVQDGTSLLGVDGSAARPLQMVLVHLRCGLVL